MVIDLGLIDYEECYRMQKDLVRRRRLGEIGDVIVLAEHDPVFTIGRTGALDNVLVPPDMLLADGLKILRVDRGGDVTYHGPGQLVVYPIVDLKAAGMDLHDYMRSLEEAAIRFLAEHSVSGERIDGKTGVWVAGKKIASVGIGASNWVTFHGMSVNICCDLKFFAMINPCGMAGVEMTSLEKIKGYKVDMRRAKAGLLRHCQSVIARKMWQDNGLTKQSHYGEALHSKSEIASSVFSQATTSSQ